MYDRLYDQQDRLATTDLVDHAAALGLDVQRFARDLGTGRHDLRVQQDLISAEAGGVTGTPTLSIAGRRHTGPYDADTLADALLHAAGAEPVDDQPNSSSSTAADGGDGDSRPNVTPDLSEDLPETPGQGGDHPRLTDAQLARLDRVGTRRPVRRGDVLYRPGESSYDFYVVLSGAVAVFAARSEFEQPVVRVHGERRFLGPEHRHLRLRAQRRGHGSHRRARYRRVGLLRPPRPSHDPPARLSPPQLTTSPLLCVPVDR